MASASARFSIAVLLVLTQPITGTSLVTACTGDNCLPGAGRRALEIKGHGELLQVADSDLPATNLVAEDAGFVNFENYANAFGKKYEHNSQEYWLRRGLFEKRSAEVKAQNEKPNRLWEAVAGKFADYTEEERAAMRGYRKSVSHVGPSSGGAGLPTEVQAMRELLRPTQGNVSLPNQFDWLNLKVARQVPDQGQCGSCWAVTAKSVLDAHHEIYVGNRTGQQRIFSAQQIISCVPNPRSCGGSGGCSGSTVELAFDWVLHNGCATETDVPYKAKDLTGQIAKCNASRQLSKESAKFFGEGSLKEGDGPEMETNGGSLFGMTGYHMLERNKERPLLEALYQQGPIATSVAAVGFYEYSGGIYDGCNANVVVDHAVTLYGYGEKTPKAEPLFPILRQQRSETLEYQTAPIKYWLIRNSWGAQWGEKGFIRMLRYDQEGKQCGKDDNNQAGTGCSGDSKNVTVCGMCGYLYDSVVPHFHMPTQAQARAAAGKKAMNPAKFVRSEE